MGKGRTTLGELMGKQGASGKGKLSLNDLPELLGDNMPQMEFSSLGRLRLVRALRKRFGADYRSLPGLTGVVKQMDEEIAFSDKVRQLKGIKFNPKKRSK